MELFEMLIIGLAIAAGLVLLSTMVLRLYRKVGPNEAMLISGAVKDTDGQNFRVVRRGGALVFPLLHKVDFLNLEMITIYVKSTAPNITKDGVPVFVEGVAQVKIIGETTAIVTAAEQLLGKDKEQIATIAHEILAGHLRAILGTLEIEELIESFDLLTSRLKEESASDLEKMGLTVVAFTINGIRDEVGYLENIGRYRTAESKRNSDVIVAEKLMESAIAQAQAESESSIVLSQKSTEASKAKINADTEIAEAAKDHEIKKSLFQAEVAKCKAVSDLAYDIVKAETEQKLVEAQKETRIIEAQKQVLLREVEVAEKEVQLLAEVTKPAEAESGRVKILALAENEKVRLLAEADWEATQRRAEGEAEALKIIARAEAEAIKLKGFAEATVIGAKGQAEAEALHRKTEALRQYNEAVLSSRVIDKLSEIVSTIILPLTNTGLISAVTTDSQDDGTNQNSSDVLKLTAQSLTMIKELKRINLDSKPFELAEDEHVPNPATERECHS